MTAIFRPPFLATFVVLVLLNSSGSRNYAAAETSNSSFSLSESPAVEILSKALEAMGYVEVDSNPVEGTGYPDFNGGLRYDEYPLQSHVGGKSYVSQQCRRLDDLNVTEEDRQQYLVLPTFHMLAYEESSMSMLETVKLTMQLLFNSSVGLGLDPQYAAIVTLENHTQDIELMGCLLDSAIGIGVDQVYFRAWDDAYATGDGSGYFNPTGHPHPEGQPSISFHWSSPENGPAAGRVESYPLSKDLVEIAEIAPGVGAIGLERADWALQLQQQLPVDGSGEGGDAVVDDEADDGTSSSGVGTFGGRMFLLAATMSVLLFGTLLL